MTQKSTINLGDEDEQLSEEAWEWFNGQLTRRISGGLFEEKGSESTGAQHDEGEFANNPEQQVEEVLNLTQADQDPPTQHESAAEDSSEESENFSHGNRKNICGYVLKQAVQTFYNASSRRLLEKQCRKQGATYSSVITHFQSTLPKVLGVTVLASALTPKTESQFPAKEVFRKFLRWFLKKRYMLTLLNSGRMSDKQSYIDVKNRQLLYFQYELAHTLLSMNSIKD